MGNRYALCVGINEYLALPASLKPLHWAKPDAEAVHQILVDPERGGFESAGLLIDAEQTTRDWILAALGTLFGELALAEDALVVLYFACHAELGRGGELMLIPYDGQWRNTPDNTSKPIIDSMLWLDDIIRYVRQSDIQNVILLLDACHSGAAEKSLAGLKLPPASNLFLLGAAQPDQSAIGKERLKHGVFTYCLLEALTRLKPGNNEGWITVTQVQSYISERLPKMPAVSQLVQNTSSFSQDIGFVHNPLPSPTRSPAFTRQVGEVLKQKGYQLIPAPTEGNQSSDILWVELSQPPTISRYLVLCLDNSQVEYRCPPGLVRSFCTLVELERQANRCDKGLLITPAGLNVEVEHILKVEPVVAPGLVSHVLLDQLKARDLTLPASQVEISEPVRIDAKRDFLEKLLADHSSFVSNRLESFVGREKELAEIRQRIAEKLKTGGYVTITGRAGQGKSSVIARLVKEYDAAANPHKGEDEVDTFDSLNSEIAHHFIPFNPGPDHQVGLLRNLMARLILKHNLSDLYVSSESRAALRDFFPRVLADLNAKGQSEVIFIDGLDQLEEELNGRRDLSFLPIKPPTGVVFVLGTRPDDTLKPLELLKPHYEYKLRDLSRKDFGLVLQHRKVTLSQELADRFYTAMQENALYLDLVAKELTEAGATSPEEIIERVADNPDNLFSLAVERFKRQRQEWREVLRPLLGILLASQEPLAVQQLCQILKLEGELVRDGLRRLAGLVAEDGEGRRYLFHLKLRDYLRQNPQKPIKDYIFDKETEEDFHHKLAEWCKLRDLAVIWEDSDDPNEQGRRLYARHHYLTHLYQAASWETLWATLDEGEYGRAKLHYDPSTRLYVQDLDLGRDSVIQQKKKVVEAISLLPRLWHYTLLRCNLASQADNYPAQLFELMVQLSREQEALGLVELMTSPEKKIEALARIAAIIKQQPGREQDSKLILLRAYEITGRVNWWDKTKLLQTLLALSSLADLELSQKAYSIAFSIEDSSDRASALSAIAQALIEMGDKEQASTLLDEATAAARSIKASSARALALSAIAETLAKAQQWQPAVELARSLEANSVRAWTLSAIVETLAKAQQWQPAIELARSLEDSYYRAWTLSAIAQALIEMGDKEQASTLLEEAITAARSLEASSASALSAIAETLAKAQQWQPAVELARSLENSSARASALSAIAETLAKAQQWQPAVELARSIKASSDRTNALRAIAEALAKAQQWQLAIELARSLEDSYYRAWALSAIAQALIEMGDKEQASTLLDEATTAARSPEDSSARAKALSAIAETLAKAQQWQLAIELARSLEDNSYRARALRAIVETLIEMGDKEQASTLLEEATTAARSIKASSDRASALRAIAETLIEMGDKEQASTLLEEATTAAYSLEDSSARTNTLRAIAERLAKAQQWQPAIELARSLEDNSARAWTLSAIAQALIEMGDKEQASTLLEEAITAARSLEASSARASALSAIAERLAKAQQWQPAVELARSIKASSARASALRAIAETLAKAQQWQPAVELARSIKASSARASALRAIVETLAKAQQWQLAIELARSIKASSDRTNALSAIAERLAKAQQWQPAVELARSLEDSYYRAWTLSAIAQALIEMGDKEQASTLLDEATTAARSIKASSDRAWTLSAIAETLAKAQQWQLAIELARSIKASSARTNTLSTIAERLAKAQQWQLAIELARSLEDSSARTWALRAIAQALIEMGDKEQASTLLEEAITAARSLEASSARALALRAIAETLAKAQQWQPAVELARSLEDNYDWARALRAIAETLIEMGDKEQASTLLEEATTAARSVEASSDRTNTLRAIARNLIQLRNIEQAVRLLFETTDDSSEARQSFELLETMAADLAQNKLSDQLLILVQSAWRQVTNRASTLQILSLAYHLLAAKPEIGQEFARSFPEVDDFLKRI